MGKFLLGCIVTLLVLILGGLGFALLGFFPTAANVEPPHWEQHLAMGAADASMERHAPRVTNPLMPNDDNLIQGIKLYTMNCALCHGPLYELCRRCATQDHRADWKPDLGVGGRT